MPAIQPEIFKEDSQENKHLIQKKLKKERQELIYSAADECTNFVCKNQPEKLMDFFKNLPKDLKIN